MGLPEQTVESELVLRGQLRDVDLETLLSALRLGRQYLTLELVDADGTQTGSVSVKSGRVVWASAGDQTGADAVRQLLDDHNLASEFRVWLQPPAAERGAESLGTIADLTRLEEAEQVERTHILRGVLNEGMQLAELLRVVAFTRQHVSLELSDQAGNVLGEVCAKAGKILSAQARELSELPALEELLRAPSGTSFDLFTEAQGGVSQLHPLGAIDEVLRRVASARKTAPPPLARAARSGIVQSPQARILEGSLEEFALSHVLRVLSTSRQQFELHVRDDEAETVGVIEVKSGLVIAASAGGLTGLAAARDLLAARSGRFVAIRRAAVPDDRPPLVSVHELLRTTVAEMHFEQALALTEAQDADDVDGDVPIPVLDGKLRDLDVASILHVAGASRQYTCVHIFDDQRTPIGVVNLKGSQVVSAQAQELNGIAAVRRLLHSPRDFSFLVQRYPVSPEISSSLGSTATILQRAAAGIGSFAPAPARAVEPARTPTELRTPQPAAARSSSWIAGTLVGAGFVLLGGIASAVVLRSPALDTSVSPSTSIAPAPMPAPPPLAAEPTPAAVSDTKQPELSEPPGQASRATIASFQAGLRQLGYETGPIDGVLGPHTTAAIKAFQYAEHLAADGTLSTATRAVLLRRINEPSD